MYSPYSSSFVVTVVVVEVVVVEVVVVVVVAIVAALSAREAVSTGVSMQCRLVCVGELHRPYPRPHLALS